MQDAFVVVEGAVAPAGRSCFEPLRGAFIRISAAPTNGSIIDNVRITPQYATSFITSKVLDSRGNSTTKAYEIEAWLKPEPTCRAAWLPGI
ncbi:hypothetical protein [Streptomyces phaeochromogenes]|uniref:hypothetical protein n=1 Tax=Streptomyces phaeochromogenes TaxID=1923 RepID=UPI00371A793E